MNVVRGREESGGIQGNSRLHRRSDSYTLFRLLNVQSGM